MKHVNFIINTYFNKTCPKSINHNNKIFSNVSLQFVFWHLVIIFYLPFYNSHEIFTNTTKILYFNFIKFSKFNKEWPQIVICFKHSTKTNVLRLAKSAFCDFILMEEKGLINKSSTLDFFFFADFAYAKITTKSISLCTLRSLICCRLPLFINSLKLQNKWFCFKLII